MNDNIDSFRVIETDDRGQPVRCSTCPREIKRVVVMPFMQRSDAATSSRPVDDEAWLGFCAYCVLEMARALARAEGKL